MKTQSPYTSLKESIQLLEEEQLIKRQVLKEQLIISYESLKPLALLNSALKDISSSPVLKNNVLGTAVGLASGFLTRKLFIGTSGNIIRRLIGAFIQLGVTNMVARHPEAIKTVGNFMIENILSGKNSKSGTRVR